MKVSIFVVVGCLGILVYFVKLEEEKKTKKERKDVEDQEGSYCCFELPEG